MRAPEIKFRRRRENNGSTATDSLRYKRIKDNKIAKL
jgi:hypothetical protein